MRGSAASDGLKLWLYLAGCAAGAAWLSPWLYNAGKALAEVTEKKPTNALLEGIAGWCRTAGFPHFYSAGLWLVAAVLFLPLLEWLKLGQKPKEPVHGPWSVRLPAGAWQGPVGQRLRPPGGLDLMQAAAGFSVTAGLLLLIGWGLINVGSFIGRGETQWMPRLFPLLALSIGLAAVQEVVFRGMALGVFLRGWRPGLAVVQAALMFMLVRSLHPGEVSVTDPEQSGAGFELVGKLLRRAVEPGFLIRTGLPVLVLGLVLGLSRWRTASLALPVGIHAGWIFSVTLYEAGTAHLSRPGLLPRLLTGEALGEGLLGMVGLMIVGTLVYQFTQAPENATTL